jgi:hypothetical protein
MDIDRRLHEFISTSYGKRSLEYKESMHTSCIAISIDMASLGRIQSMLTLIGE